MSKNSLIRARYTQATEAHKAGNLTRARSLYQEVLADNPQHADARHLLGLIYSQQGDLARAVQELNKATTLDPGHAIYHNNLGEAYRRQGYMAQAEASYRQAIRLAPTLAEAQFNLANLLKAQGANDAAIEHYQRALSINDRHHKALYNLANTYLAIGRYRSAIETYRRLVALFPDHPQGWNNLGAALKAWDDLDEAAAAYRQAIALDPNAADGYDNLGQILEAQGDRSGAREHYEKGLERRPNGGLALHCATLAPLIPPGNLEIDAYRLELHALLQALQNDPPTLTPEATRLTGEPPFLLAYQGRDDLPIKRLWAGLYAHQIPQREPVKNTGQPHVGFVVTQGHEGVFLKCMRGILNHFPTENLRVSVVCSRPNGEAILRPGISNPAVQFVSLPARLDEALTTLETARFDLLHYWEIGTDATNYFLPFFRPARVQCTTWGWPVTSGIAQVAYYLSAAGLEPANGEQHYSETLLRLQHLPTYYYRPPVPDPLPTRTSFALPADKHWYLCGQNLRKVHPDMDPLFAGILRRDAQALLIFLEDTQRGVTNLLRRRLEHALPDVYARVHFLPRMEEERYLALTAHADVVLDTLHYGGGANTCYDAFAAGTPIITWPGDYQRGRWAKAIYECLDIHDAIAGSADEYVELATRYATEREPLSARIKERVPALFENRAPVLELAQCFEQLLA